MSSKKGGGLSASSAGLKRSQWSDLCAEPVWRSDTWQKSYQGIIGTRKLVQRKSISGGAVGKNK